MSKRLLVIISAAILIAGGGFYIRQLIHETVETQVAGQQYVVSLGDSVAAGAGLSDKRAQGCDLSDKAYPLLISAQLKEPVEQLACSGATIEPIPGGRNNVYAQLAAARPFLHGSDVVITAGANDIGWLKFLTSCATTDCATDANRTDLTAKLHGLQQQYGALLASINMSHPRRLVVNTYYSLLAEGGNCALLNGITPDEINFINAEETQLNAAITAAAADNKLQATQIDFNGHLLCAETPWLQSIRDAAPLHPTAAGQAQIAAQDLRALR